MKYGWLGCLVFGGLLFAGNQQDMNVNSRYIVESVEIAGRQDEKISSTLREEMNRLVGERVDVESIDDLARRIRKELHVNTVTHKLIRGDEAEHVKVVFDVKGRRQNVDVNIPKVVFNSRQGWTGTAEVSTGIAGNTFAFGLVSDNDTLPDRYAGVTARYERHGLGTDALGFSFSFGSYHDQWTQSTENALQPPATGTDLVPGIYRTRQDFEPALTYTPVKPLTLTVGMGFERFETQYPNARFQGANAVVTTLRYHQQVEDSDANKHDVDASYSLRAATRALDSDFAYVRHLARARYEWKRGNQEWSDEVFAGMIIGQAPLFERFVLGNSFTLRGWNRFDIDPAGGDRVVHNTVDYRYRMLEAFWDTGAIWNRNETAVPRHSLGAGVRDGAFFLAVAFPVKYGRVEPIFILGMNY
jgi:outer membrane protein assembly factor BamA